MGGQYRVEEVLGLSERVFQMWIRAPPVARNAAVAPPIKPDAPLIRTRRRGRSANRRWRSRSAAVRSWRKRNSRASCRST